MTVKHKMMSHVSADAAGEEQWPGIDSRYRLIIVAALRAKQLQRGATPRIEADLRRRRNTSIALEETKQGLVPFTDTTPAVGAADDSGGQGSL